MAGPRQRDRRWASTHDPRSTRDARRTPRRVRRAIAAESAVSPYWSIEHFDLSVESGMLASDRHQIDPCTVILPGFPRRGPKHVAAVRDLNAFLRDQRMRRVNSGFVESGYAVRFADKTMAAAFRLLWQGKTILPQE